MASQRFNLHDFLVGLLKFVMGVAIALFVISLAGVATARYFLTQLSSVPERPVYENDAPVAEPPSEVETESAAPQPATAQPPVQPSNTASNIADAQALYQVIVTYGAGLLVRTGAGVDYETIDGIDYDETVEVLEESGRWLKVRTNKGVEGWIKGQGNTQRL